MGNLGKKLQKRSQEKLKEDNLKYVTWIRDLVNIVHNSNIAVKELEAALNSKEGSTAVNLDRVKELKSVYVEVLDFFSPKDGGEVAESSEEASNG